VDIKAYIQSGIIESYVLGMTSAGESAELEELRPAHPEIDDAINEFSAALEEKAFENAVTPPPAIKQGVMTAIKKEHFTENLTSVRQIPQQTPVLPINTRTPWRFVAAAAVILLVASTALNIFLYKQFRDKNEDYEALLSERQTLLANSEVYQTQLKEWQVAASMIADSNMAMVKMRSTNEKDNAATVFWNTKNKDVYVMVNKLPEPKSGKQYQLWAMVDGKPVDAGVLNPLCSSVCKMKNIPKADAFAITLEKEGGSPVPNLKAIYVIGNV
jgi:anti-sigma-K factor RskA